MPRSAAGKAAREREAHRGGGVEERPRGRRGGARWRNSGGRGGRGGRRGRWAPGRDRARAPGTRVAPGPRPPTLATTRATTRLLRRPGRRRRLGRRVRPPRVPPRRRRGRVRGRPQSEGRRRRDDDETATKSTTTRARRRTRGRRGGSRGPPRRSRGSSRPRGRSSRPRRDRRIPRTLRRRRTTPTPKIPLRPDPSPSAAASRPSAADDDSARAASRRTSPASSTTNHRAARVHKPEWAHAARDELRVPASSRKKGLSGRRRLRVLSTKTTRGRAAARGSWTPRRARPAPQSPSRTPRRARGLRRSSWSAGTHRRRPLLRTRFGAAAVKKRAGNETTRSRPRVPPEPGAPFASRAQAGCTPSSMAATCFTPRGRTDTPSDAPGAGSDRLCCFTSRGVCGRGPRHQKCEALARRA